MKRKFNRIAFVTPSVVLAACGGGGGSFGPSPTGEYVDTASGIYATEYAYNDMLSSINPLSLNNYGYTGSGVRVAVVDSGIDANHPEFNGRTIYGYDFASSSSGYARDENGHGSHVASIIAGERDGYGMRGVAYDATLYSYKVDNDGDGGLEAANTDAQITSIFNRHVTDNIDVSNNSWGWGTSVTSVSSATAQSLLGNTMTAAAAAQNNGTLIVFAAGNDGNSQPSLTGALPYHDSSLAGAWLTVVAIDNNLRETAYTNRCGVAQSFCVTAPGGADNSSSYGIRAADAGTTNYVRSSGTSMAAPHVSGLAAALMEKFPNLTPAQIATRIKSTASLASLTSYGGGTLSSLGETAMRAIFGYGLVNAEGASAQIGSLSYPIHGTLSGAVDLSSERVALPAGLSSSSVGQIMASTYAVFDTFDGAIFRTSGDQIFSEHSQAHVPGYAGGSLSSTSAASDHVSLFQSGDYQSGTTMEYSFAQQGSIDPAHSYWGQTANLFEDAPGSISAPQFKFQHTTSYDNANISYFASFTADASAGTNTQNGELGVSGNFGLTDSTTLIASASFGDQPTVLGLQGSAINTSSVRMQVGLRSQLRPGLSFFGRYEHQQYDDMSPSIIAFGSNDLTAENIMFAVEAELQNGGQLAVGAKTEYQYSNGSVSLYAPTSVTRSGDIIYSEQSFEMEADNVFQPFLAYSIQTENGAIDFGAVASSFSNPKLEGVRLGISRHF
ncbi:MAG: S8 family serine peptidase [Pseudohongiellaceae bacterium]